MKIEADQIAKFHGLTAKQLGLRFDRVALSLLQDFKAAVDRHRPDMIVVLTITAPLRLPAKTCTAIEQALAEVFIDRTKKFPLRFTAFGNHIQIQSHKKTKSAKTTAIGFVHNPATDPVRLFELTQIWLERKPR